MSDRDKRPAGSGLPAGEWLSIFRGAKVEVERLDAAKGEQGRATVMGNFLARMLDREVHFQVDGRMGKATLRAVPGRSRQVRYHFEILWDEDQHGPDAEDAPQPTNPKLHTPNTARRSEERKPEQQRESPIDRSPATGLVPAGNNEPW